MKNHLVDACCARMPRAALPHLGILRAHEGVRVVEAGEHLWLFWPAGDEELARTVLAQHQAELYVPREGHWFRLGHHLPCFAVPEAALARPLSARLFPQPVDAEEPVASHGQRVAITLVRDATPRPAVALGAGLTGLRRWADRATSYEMEALQAAWWEDRVLLLGRRLPAVPGERYWGRHLLIPLGYRLEPAVDGAVVRQVLGLEAEDVALFTLDGIEVIAGAAFGPVTRAGIRLAAKERIL